MNIFVFLIEHVLMVMSATHNSQSQWLFEHLWLVYYSHVSFPSLPTFRSTNCSSSW